MIRRIALVPRLATKRKSSKLPATATAPKTEIEKEFEAYVAARRLPIAETSLPIRIVNALEDEGIILVNEIMPLTREQLLNFKNFAEKTMTELVKAVKKLGLKPPDNWLSQKPKCRYKSKKNNS